MLMRMVIQSYSDLLKGSEEHSAMDFHLSLATLKPMAKQRDFDLSLDWYLHLDLYWQTEKLTG